MSGRGRTAPLRRELLIHFAVLFAAAVLLAIAGVLVALPFLSRPTDATLFLALLMVADLAVLFAFASYVLRRKLVRPVEQMVDDVRRMSEGGEHRIRAMPSTELQAIADSVNALADRLMRDQVLLAENVASLERTNAELVEARDHVTRAARLASVGTLAAGIAHEVGNPLGAILGYTDVARSRALREGRDAALLDAIRDEVCRIDRTVRSLLHYARPSGKEEAPVSPRPVLERVRELLAAQGKLDGVEQVWRFEEALPQVDIDSGRLEQIMVNLLLNGLDAMDGRARRRLEVTVTSEPGPATVLPRRREGDPRGVDYRHRRRLAGGNTDPTLLFGSDRVVAIRIADSGPGILEDDLERIFDPFFTTKAPGKGTGLGLSICARLVESMGGRIEAANGEGGGAVFRVRLPGVAARGAGAAPAGVATGGVQR